MLSWLLHLRQPYQTMPMVLNGHKLTWHLPDFATVSPIFFCSRLIARAFRWLY